MITTHTDKVGDGSDQRPLRPIHATRNGHGKRRIADMARNVRVGVQVIVREEIAEAVVAAFESGRDETPDDTEVVPVLQINRDQRPPREADKGD